MWKPFINIGKSEMCENSALWNPSENNFLKFLKPYKGLLQNNFTKNEKTKASQLKSSKTWSWQVFQKLENWPTLVATFTFFEWGLFSGHIRPKKLLDLNSET